MTDGRQTTESSVSSEVLDHGCTTSDNSEETVDPRVQVELERLNAATDLINKLEIELDEARSSFRMLLSESSQRVNQLARQLGSCVEKARPYYEARMKAKQNLSDGAAKGDLQARTQKAALRYERASSAHAAAKEMVYLAEEGLKKEGRCFDPAWQEMLNHATMRVNEAESERILSQRDHQQTSMAYNEAEKVVQQLHQEVKRAIVKSSLSTRRSLLQINNLAIQHQLQLLPYFEMKAHFNQLLDEQRRKVHRLEENVLKVKMSYADALHNLEEISDEIHHKRQQLYDIDVNKRSQGVGAESPEAVGSRHTRMSSESSEELLNDVYEDDIYKSLPSEFSPRVSVKAEESQNVSKGDHEREAAARFYGSHHKRSQGNEPFSVTSKKDVAQVSAGQELVERNTASVTEAYTEECMANQIKHLTVKDNSVLCESSSLQIDRSPDGAEIPSHRLHAVDLNILRVQKEDLSDSESLASNDTADTLDDNQIECLLLDRVLSTEYQNTFPFDEQNDTDNESTKQFSS